MTIFFKAMNIYYLQPHSAGKAEIYCVVIGRKSYYTEYHLKENFAATSYMPATQLRKQFIDNYSEYKLMNAQKAKEQIVKAELEMYLPIIQRNLVFEQRIF